MSLAQSPDFFKKSFTEETTDQEKFTMYLDSINKYLYRDIHIAEIAIANCQSLIEQGIDLPDSSLFDFVLESIYYKHSMADPIGAYQLIARWEPSLDSIDLSIQRKGRFMYIKGFTYMAIGDLEAAQNTYYENLEIAKANRDTARMLNSLYSLGQLYNDEKDFEEAIQQFQQILSYSKRYLRPSTLALVYFELGESYSLLKQFDQALETLQTAYETSEKYDLQVLKSDILIFEGRTHIMANQLDSAQHVYEQLLRVNEGSQDQNNINDTQIFLAQLFVAQKKYAQALQIHKKILEEIPDTDLDTKMEIYDDAHRVCNEMKDYETAYAYLVQLNEVKKKRDDDVKKQKTRYLKIKFDSDQKEKENALLTTTILQSQTESILLYSGLALSFLVLVILLGAFYQKQRYSKNLEREVLNRTVNLRTSNNLLNQSNSELQEFNRILSHDLKEPLRSIVGFGQLASSKLAEDSEIQEYLGYVTQSGIQLQQLIESINVFQVVSTSDANNLILINIPSLLHSILMQVQHQHPNKEITFQHNATVSMLGHLDTLKSVFDIVIDNAVKFNEEDIVSISVHYYTENQNHCFEIEDNGIGIASAYHHQIFDMFKRLHNRKDFGGSGLGLSIAKKLLERIGGDISVMKSKKKEGTTFLLRFPEVVEVE